MTEFEEQIGGIVWQSLGMRGKLGELSARLREAARKEVDAEWQEAISRTRGECGYSDIYAGQVADCVRDELEKLRRA